ncbi:MAG: tetratricopeptide repeat protein [Candidatus Bathyarchaeia archaeon]
MVTVADTLRDAPLSQAIEKFSSAPPAPPECCFGDYVCVDGWFIKKKAFGGFDTFKATDVCWVYPQKYAAKSLIMKSVSWTIVMKVRPDREVQLGWEKHIQAGVLQRDSDMGTRLADCLNRLKSILPWATFGYSEIWKNVWDKSRVIFFSNQDKEIARIRAEKEDIPGMVRRIEAAKLSTGDYWSDEGYRLLGEGYFEKAIVCLDKALEINPKNQWAWYNKGVSLGNLGRFEEAIKCYDKALEIGKHLGALKNKGAVLEKLGRFEEAAECYVALACYYNDDGAIEQYDKALEISPKNQWAWYNKGVRLGNLGRFEEAIKCYDKALQITPNDSVIQEKRQIAVDKLCTERQKS